MDCLWYEKVDDVGLLESEVTVSQQQLHHFTNINISVHAVQTGKESLLDLSRSILAHLCKCKMNTASLVRGLRRALRTETEHPPIVTALGAW